MSQHSRQSAPTHYTLRVDGRLDDRWSSWFDNLTVTPDVDGTTRLSGPVSDQAQLHGLLVKVRDLGLTLISVESSSRPAEVSAMTPTAVASQQFRTRAHSATECRPPQRIQVRPTIEMTT
jgi:hypothetical protein